MIDWLITPDVTWLIVLKCSFVLFLALGLLVGASWIVGRFLEMSK